MFCQRLKKLRESHNFNKKQMSKILGLPYTTYNNYETGAREPSSDVLIKISTTFNVTIDYLLGVLPEKEPAIVFELTENDKIIIKKYHQLDLRGQQAVLDTLNREYSYISNNNIMETSEIVSDAIDTIDNISEVLYKNQPNSVRKK